MLGNIQILRFVAATLVVLFHVVQVGQKGGSVSPLLSHFGAWGEAGVDIFFVISGLVMMMSQAHKPRTVGQFLTERAIRIVPMYWIFTLLLAALLLFLPQLFNSAQFSFDKTLASLFFVNWLVGDGFPTVFLGWTLEYEWLFYIALSLSCAFVPLRFAWIPVTLFFLALNTAGLIGFFAMEFVYGMLIGQYYVRGGKLPFPAVICLAGLASLLAVALLSIPELPRHVGYGVPAALIVAGLVWMPQANNRATLFMGAASYSIYLIQVFTMPVLFRVFAKAPQLPNDVVVLGVVAGSLIAGALAYRLVELPISRWLHRWNDRKKQAY